MCVASSGKSLKFLKEIELNLIVDSNRIALGEGSYDSDIDIGSVEEDIMLVFIRTTNAINSYAETFEFQLGEIESSIGREKLGLFSQYQKAIVAYYARC